MNRMSKRALHGIAIFIIMVTISGVLPPLVSRGVQAQSSFRFVSWADTKSATRDLSTLSDQAGMLANQLDSLSNTWRDQENKK